ncbi:MAG: class I SAM-dependent methyltransferase [Clostridia bacterium]|nr:class I SAM-dependent methyltransferase [Clostridia bacterium]
MWLADKWESYEVLGTGGGEKLEKWGDYVLRRPDPQTVWKIDEKNPLWKSVDGHYHRSNKGGGSWEFKNKLPESWNIDFKPLGIKFIIRPTGFKHTGLFPEQATNWVWFSELIKKANRPINVLNLFAYTGGASVAAASAGASVCHVDSSKGMVTWAKDNLALSGLGDKPVRFIVDDVNKFVEREIRRGKKYDAVIMDPPSYGRGPGGELWKIEDELYPLVTKCMEVLSDNPLFFLINSYTTGLAPSVLENILKLTMREKFGGSAKSDEIGLPVKNSDIVLPCGASGRWQAE